MLENIQEGVDLTDRPGRALVNANNLIKRLCDLKPGTYILKTSRQEENDEEKPCSEVNDAVKHYSEVLVFSTEEKTSDVVEDVEEKVFDLHGYLDSTAWKFNDTHPWSTDESLTPPLPEGFKWSEVRECHIPDIFRPVNSLTKMNRETCRAFQAIGICPDPRCVKRHLKTNLIQHCWEFADAGSCPRGDACMWRHITENELVTEAKMWFHIGHIIPSYCTHFAKKGACKQYADGTCTSEHLTKESVIARFESLKEKHLTDEKLAERAQAMLEKLDQNSRHSGRKSFRGRGGHRQRQHNNHRGKRKRGR